MAKPGDCPEFLEPNNRIPVLCGCGKVAQLGSSAARQGCPVRRLVLPKLFRFDFCLGLSCQIDTWAKQD